MEPCDLPDEVIRSLRRVLSMLGLRFGAFDIAETADGEYVFFEVNEAGQWLWQEIHCPECRILQPFCEFLLNASDNFYWDPSRNSIEYSAAEVCRYLEGDPRYNDQSSEKFPDEEVRVSDEREHFVAS